jgi:hypothetical protein
MGLNSIFTAQSDSGCDNPGQAIMRTPAIRLNGVSLFLFHRADIVCVVLINQNTYVRYFVQGEASSQPARMV